MIAPLREIEPKPAEVRRRFRQARRLIAATLLGPSGEPARQAQSVPAWQAWLLAAWVVTVAIACSLFAFGFP